jgi:hypothetical protein
MRPSFDGAIVHRICRGWVRAVLLGLAVGLVASPRIVHADDAGVGDFFLGPRVGLSNGYGWLVGWEAQYQHIGLLVPKTLQLPSLDPDNGEELVPYRMLSIEDFQAEGLPSEYGVEAKNVGALTVVVIQGRPVTVHFLEVPSNPDSVRWEGTVDEPTWETYMAPKLSWWNPKKKKGGTAERILRHEQDHFDISELVVRYENDRKAETRLRISATGPTQDDVAAEVKRRRENELARINENSRAWNAKYDLETKNGIDKKAQKEWDERILKWLAGSPPGDAP